MFLMTLMRTAFMVCVPLFLMLTGYLMHQKQLKKGYYTGILKPWESIFWPRWPINFRSLLPQVHLFP